ncbi:uncharacterized protein LOC110096336 [Dendrobium catenatum]|uniref:DUF7895 domain-containing protein n=1 Tax=Dendrobium catenatum TaxID=906689 RepID=A0A2I0WET2_9ASPA|nr:uncharacterized protein LOC110096336 [Dendrobium catenatum]PKU74155.1 hypothetical protein MA16_Dca020131 [Dendrobium catenatum]
MECALVVSLSSPFFPRTANNDSCAELGNAIISSSGSSLNFRSVHGRKNHLASAALPENSPSIILAAMAVGAAATLLARRTTSPISNDITTKPCEECAGSGVCSACNGEGFILKKLSTESADRARMASKNMATRYTAGLPKKWSYCNKCSSSRYCRACDGTGSVNS